MIKSFKQFITEAFDSQHVGHLTHFEDAGHESGHEGASHAIKALHKMHDHMLHGRHDSSLTTKVDGGVSWAASNNHPINGKKFVSYKGAIGKIGTDNETGVCYSHADIDKHFEGKPYLIGKMKSLLDHAHKVLPHHGVFQGDLLHTGDDVKHTKDKVSFAPNTISYSAKKSSAEGKKIAASRLGISVHTKYNHHPDHGLIAEPVKHDELKHHDDVYNLSTSNDTSKANYTEEHQAKFAHHMNEAEKIHANGHEMYSAIHPHGSHIGTYINKCVRSSDTPSTEGLKKHIHSSYQKDIDKLKTESGKSKKEAHRNAVLNHIDTNSHHFDNYFKMHHHLQQAKNTLVHVLDNADHPLEHHIEGKKTAPEGYVSYHSGKPFKAVNREAFSKANFAKVRD